MTAERRPEPVGIGTARRPSGAYRETASVGVLGQAAADRTRLLEAIGSLSRERSWSALSAARICERAGVPRRAFNLSFGSVEECFVAAVDAALVRLWAAVERERAEAEPEWAAQVSAAIVGFLRFVDRDPAAAWMCVVAPLGGSERAQEARKQTMDRFVALIQSGPDSDAARERSRVSTGNGAVGGLWEMARQYLSDPDGDVRIDEVAGSSIFLALTPYLPRDEAMRHAFSIPALRPSGAGDQPRLGAVGDDGAVPPLTDQAVEALAFIGSHPRAADHEISAATGIEHDDQISRQLRRLEDLGLVTFEREGRSKRWMLSTEGQRVTRRLAVA